MKLQMQHPWRDAVLSMTVRAKQSRMSSSVIPAFDEWLFGDPPPLSACYIFISHYFQSFPALIQTKTVKSLSFKCLFLELEAFKGCLQIV